MHKYLIFHTLTAKFQSFFMQYVAAIVPAAPLRSEASHRSEMISQMLFGEKAVVLDQKGDFSKIKNLFDHYEGWIQTSQLTEVSKHFMSVKPTGYTEKNNTVLFFNDSVMILSAGTPIYRVRKIGKYKIKYKKVKPIFADYADYSEEKITGLAAQYMNTSYLWGGRSSFGIDCSGFSQQVLKHFGKMLKRDASQQATQGEVVGFLQAAQCGDLAFFDNEEGHITHVGILLSPNTIIHSSGRVHIDKIDNEGIISTDLGVRTHRLRIIRRL